MLVKLFSIIKETGEPLISISLDSSLNEVLIGGFFTALYNFGISSLDDSISKFSVESDKMRIDSLSMNFENYFTLIAIAFLSIEVEHKKFIYFAEKILYEFGDKYFNSLRDFKGDISEFEEFKDHLRNEIKDTFKVEENGFTNKMDNIFQRILDGDLSGIDEL
ncbi:MAG: hypothetical protein ACTSR8_03400 [Promethearchaeota archaeon]